MAYSVVASVIFKLPAAEVYKALTSLDELLMWNTGMVKVSKSGYMKEHMLVETESIVMGQTMIANLEIVKLEQDSEIEFINNAGPISYRGIYRLLPISENETEVVSMIQFEFRSFGLKLARHVIESMAQSRIKSDLELLRAIKEA